MATAVQHRVARRTAAAKVALDMAAESFVRTPELVAGQLVSGHVELGLMHRGALVLEPSAGDGAIVRELLDYDEDVHVLAVEPNAERVAALKALAAEYPGRVTVYAMTFEAFAASNSPQVDAVVMNPPFVLDGDNHPWIRHVNLAYDMLRPGAQLVAVVPPSYQYRKTREHQALRNRVEAAGGRYEPLPRDSFVESGTGTSAGVLTFPKPIVRDDGRPSWLLDRLPQGEPVRAKGLPATTARAALETPVQVYEDAMNGYPDRVVRFAGTCFGCMRMLWKHDDGSEGATVWELNSAVEAESFGEYGPAIGVCLTCFHNNGPAIEKKALKLVAAYWSDQPAGEAEPDGPVVYPLDLGPGLWVTATGPDWRGVEFTFTGEVMADPVQVEHDNDVCVILKLRGRTGTDIELRADPAVRVVLLDAPSVWLPPAVSAAPVTPAVAAPVAAVPQVSPWRAVLQAPLPFSV